MSHVQVQYEESSRRPQDALATQLFKSPLQPHLHPLLQMLFSVSHPELANQITRSHLALDITWT